MFKLICKGGIDMMLYVRMIDENGFFVKDAFVDALTEFTIEMPCPSGFYLPKWDGINWIEGGGIPEQTPEQQAYQIQQQLDTLDNPRDAEDVYMAMINNTPLSARTLERFEKKQALRGQLRALLNLT